MDLARLIVHPADERSFGAGLFLFFVPIVSASTKRPKVTGIACPSIDEYNVLISVKEKDASV
jgi:hypothetical protein